MASGMRVPCCGHPSQTLLDLESNRAAGEGTGRGGGHYGVKPVQTGSAPCWCDTELPKPQLPARGTRTPVSHATLRLQVTTHARPEHTPGPQHTRSKQWASRALPPTITILFVGPKIIHLDLVSTQNRLSLANTDCLKFQGESEFLG